MSKTMSKMSKTMSKMSKIKKHRGGEKDFYKKNF